MKNTGLALTGLTLTGFAALGLSGEPHTHEWGPAEEYGEYLASPEELAKVPVDRIIQSIRMNGQAMRLGEKVYEQHCASCHGLDLKGIRAEHTPDLTDAHWRFAGDDMNSVGATKWPSDVEWTVRYGVRSGHPYARGVNVGMLAYDPKFRTEKDTEDFGSEAFLSTKEIADMTEYVLKLGGQTHDAKMANRAEPLFHDHSKGNCFDCHGRSGTGIAAFGSTNLTRPDLYIYGSDRAGILESINIGRHSVMPAFEDKLKPEELHAVSVYVFAQAEK